MEFVSGDSFNSAILEFVQLAKLCLSYVIAYLDESDVRGLLSEALSADVETVFADQTGLVCANAAVNNC